MISTPATALRTASGLALAAGLLLSLAGCGHSDDSAPSPASTSTSTQQPEGEPATATTATSAASEPTTGAEAEEDSDDDSSLSSGLDGLGSALEQTLGGVDNYTVDGSTLRIEFDPDVISSNDLPSACSMVEQLAGSLTLPEGSSAEVILGSETLECTI